MPYSFDDALESANTQFGGSSASGFYTIKEGNENVVRVLTPGVEYASQFMGMGKPYRTLYGREKGDPLRQPDESDADKQGRLVVPTDKDGKPQRPSIKSVLYVLDRADGGIKIAEFPYVIGKQIGALQKNPDYAFEDLPMPYDIRITFKKDAAPNEKYRVEVKPNGEDLSPETLAELEDKVVKRSPESVAQRKKDEQIDDDMKKGLRISEDELAKTASDFNRNMAVQAAAQRAANTEPVIQYPADEINPEDIPF